MRTVFTAGADFGWVEFRVALSAVKQPATGDWTLKSVEILGDAAPKRSRMSARHVSPAARRRECASHGEARGDLSRFASIWFDWDS